MKIYFHASLIGKEKYLKNYNVIVRLLRKLNHEVFANHILKKKYEFLSKASKNEICEDIHNQKEIIKTCDAIIIESTFPSIGVGYIIAYALAQHKSVLVFYQKTPHAILLSERNRLLTLRKYDATNEKSVLHDLQSFLEKSKKKILKYRLNIMIDQSLNDLLSLEATKLHISKASYLRRLIFEKMTISKKVRHKIKNSNITT